jgi:hypothetical protein
VHARLTEIGFLDFWNKRAKTLDPGMKVFIDVKPDKYGNFNNALSKRHNGRLQKYCQPVKQQSIYSLRHNFRDACRLCIKRGLMQRDTMLRFMGHRIGGMDDVYGDPLPLQWESDCIDHIAYDSLKLC